MRTVVDESGTVLEVKDYFGSDLRIPDRSAVYGAEEAAEDFTGHEWDAAAGLHYAGARYSKRRIQQIVKATAKEAGIARRVYPHLLRHTAAQHLADRGMPENLLQQFLGHDNPETTQIYYEPKRTHVKKAHREAMGG